MPLDSWCRYASVLPWTLVDSRDVWEIWHSEHVPFTLNTAWYQPDCGLIISWCSSNDADRGEVVLFTNELHNQMIRSFATL